MISADVFRRARVRVMKKTLETRGFLHGKGNVYWRETPESHVHSLKFATGGRFRNIFAVDLGFHYSFVPPIDWGPTCYEKERFSPYKCGLHTRLRQPNNSQFFDYGETIANAEKLLEKIGTQILAKFDKLERICSDGRTLLSAVPPDILEADRLLYYDFGKGEKRIGQMHIAKLFRGWETLITEVGVLLGYLALRLGDADDAAQFQEIAAKSDPGWHSSVVASLKTEIGASRRRAKSR